MSSVGYLYVRRTLRIFGRTSVSVTRSFVKRFPVEIEIYRVRLRFEPDLVPVTDRHSLSTFLHKDSTGSPRRKYQGLGRVHGFRRRKKGLKDDRRGNLNRRTRGLSSLSGTYGGDFVTNFSTEVTVWDLNFFKFKVEIVVLIK